MRVVFMGTPAFAVPSFKALVAAGHEVVGVFTQPDRPCGRGCRIQMSPVKELALSLNIPVYQPLKIRKDGLADLQALSPDLCVTAAFGQILSEEVLAVPKHGTINVHASLLPRHRGPAPVHWAVMMDDPVAGVTTMLTDKGIDTGDMLLRAETPITDEDTAGTLLCRLADMGAELLTQTIARLEKGDCPREKQNETLMTYEPKLTRELGELNFTESTRQNLCRVRAMSPFPGAYAALADGVLKVWHAVGASPNPGAAPGTVLTADRKRGLVIATANGAIELTEIQAPNARRMDARAYLCGHTIEAGKPLNEVHL